MHARAAVLATLALLAAAPGCSAIAARDPGPAPCDVDPMTGDPCPPPSHCVMGFCDAACQHPMPEVCNGLDDDCSGTADDGLDVDADHDGFSACNTAMPMLSDCNDGDPTVHPGAPEICNGFDDDCNPATSDLATRCPDMSELCAVALGESLPRCLNPRDCTLVPCPSGQLCSTDSTCCVMGTSGCGAPTDCRTMACGIGERCTPPGTSSTVWTCQPLTMLGGTCTADRDCASGHCYPSDALGLGSGVCGAPCCTDLDCPTAGSVCFAPGTGARSCVLTTALGTAGHAYSLCTNSNECSSSDDCIDGAIHVPGGGTAQALVCGTPSGGSCLDGSCPSGVCLGSSLVNYCAYACGSDGDCNQGLGNACRYIADGSSQLTLCTIVSASGGGGQACSADRDCRDGLCLTGMCADTCCHDASCGGGMCAPVSRSGHYEMRCVPRAPT